MHREPRLFDMVEEPCNGARAAHRVPLVAQATGVEREWIARIDFFGGGLIRGGDETRAAVRGRKHAIRVKALAAFRSTFGHRPLLRAGGLEDRVRQARDVEVAPARARAMLVENLLRRGVRKHARRMRTL